MARAVKETEQDSRISDLINQIEEEMRTPKPSRREIDALWKDAELGLFGKFSQAFSRFMYFNYHYWDALANDSPYMHLHKASEDSYRKLVPAIAAQVREKGIAEMFFKGLSPEVDKLLLENLVRSGTPIAYHPIDISQEAVERALKIVKEHLASKFGDSWTSLITLGENRAMDFKDKEAKGKEKSCVIYSGCDLMNGIAMWEDARETAKVGGIVVANAAVTPDTNEWPSYWLGLYDNPQDKAMFINGLKRALPDFFSEKNHGKWNLSFSYIQEKNSWSECWGRYQTPAIVAQIDVKEAMKVNTQSPASGSLVELTLKPRKAGEPPFVLGISTKLSTSAFLQSVPENFGLKQINYVTEKIGYEENGRQGEVAAAIFEVGKLSANSVSASDLTPKMLRA